MPEKQNEQELTTPQEVEALRKQTADRSSLIKRYSFSIAFAVVFFVVIAFALGLFGGPGENVAAKDVAAWYAGKFADVFLPIRRCFWARQACCFATDTAHTTQSRTA